jgi:hypothetical protein
MKMRIRRQLEADIQAEFFRVFPLKFPDIPQRLLFAVPNGGSRHTFEAANLKRQGVKAGVADVILLLPTEWHPFLCIEFKTQAGRQTEEQKDFQRQAELVVGKYVVARSVHEALEIVEAYITVPATMELLNVKKTRLWQLNERGLRITCKVGQRTLYRHTDIERFLGEDKKDRK